jgi:hypothetical protein
MKTLKIPRALPGYVERTAGTFVHLDTATVADWREQKRINKTADCAHEQSMRLAVSRMVRLADLLGVSDETPLWPYLQSLAARNVVTLLRKPGAR